MRYCANILEIFLTHDTFNREVKTYEIGLQYTLTR